MWLGQTLTNGACIEAEKTITDDGRFIPTKYSEFVEVFSKVQEDVLVPHRSINHAMDLELHFKLPSGRIHNLSEVTLKTLKVYIETNLANGFIQGWLSWAAAPILFAKMKDGEQRLCVDYRVLNSDRIKNQYPLPVISEMLDRLRGARIFTQLGLRNTYPLFWIKEDE
jgi:hypothetical protein